MLLAVLNCLHVAWAVLRLALAVGLLAWLAVALWLALYRGRTDHLFAVLLILVVCGSLRRGASPRWRPRGGPALWYRGGMRADLHE